MGDIVEKKEKWSFAKRQITTPISQYNSIFISVWFFCLKKPHLVCPVLAVRVFFLPVLPRHP